MVVVYGRMYTGVQIRLREITKQIEEARARGEIVNQAWLSRQKRYGDLLRQVDQELQRFAEIATASITKQQAGAVKAALGDSVKLMEAAADEVGMSASF